MTVGDLLDEQSRTRPDTPALIDERGDRTLTFAQLQHAVSAAAAWWQAQGLRRGDAVLVFVPMSADLYIALLGLFRFGAVALFLDPSSGRAHLENCCARWKPDALLAVPKAHLLRLRSPALRKIPLKVAVGGWVPFARRWPTAWSAAGRPTGALNEMTFPTPRCRGVPRGRPVAHHVRIPSSTSNGTSARDAPTSAEIYDDEHRTDPPKVDPNDAALVTFTSGSTGIPKAAVRTHAFLLAQYRALAPNLQLQPGDVDLATLPIFVLANLAAGVTTVIPDVDLRRPGDVDAARIFDQIERRHVSRITASPALFERLVEFGQQSGRTLPTLRQLHTGGAPVFPRLLEAVGRLAPGAHVVAVYGSTEAEPIAHLDRESISTDDLSSMAAGRGLLAGAPVPEVRLAILADEFGRARTTETADSFHAAHLPAGAVGEIVVAGDHVLKGYLGGEGDEETKFQVAEEIWHRTGDAGCIDERGRLWLSGRCSARIDDNNSRLYPFGVECVAMTFPEVRRASFVTFKGRRVLVVAAEAGVSAVHALETKLAAAVSWAGINSIVFVERIPVDRRHNAKIDYPALQRLLESQRA